MQKFLVIFSCLGLGGCVAPPIFTYVSMAMDGASLVATGKSVGDHALSAVINEDCALLRVFTEQDVNAVCREYPSEDQQVAATATATEPVVDSSFAMPYLEIEPEKIPPLAHVDPEPILPVAFMDGMGKSGAWDEKLGNQQAIYLMIGNFPSVEGAEKLAARVTGISASVAPAMAGDNSYFRVVAGPIAPGETGAAQSRLAAVGINNSWVANLCRRTLGAPPCDNP